MCVLYGRLHDCVLWSGQPASRSVNLYYWKAADASRCNFNSMPPGISI